MEHSECKTQGCNNVVFSRGLCRKHYERERLATASPCSVAECNRQSHRADMCDYHYRKHLKSKRPLCSVPNCGEPQHNLTHKLCSLHMSRLRHHSTLTSPRSVDWGSREKHEHYKKWTWHKRGGASTMCQEWRDDFWLFAETIGVKPAGHKLARPNRSKPIGPDNWEWKETVSNSNSAYYAREWRKRNPDKAKNIDLKKQFGITLMQYNQMLLEQKGVCAICSKPSTTLAPDGGPVRLAVDHDHETGKIRGLLCHHCNKGIGCLNDSVDILKKAIDYLNNSKVCTKWGVGVGRSSIDTNVL